MCGETLVNNGINEKFEIKGWSSLLKKDLILTVRRYAFLS